VPENQATQQLTEVLARIAKLPSLNLEPPQFFANYLQLAVAATGSRGGAIWVNQPGEGPAQCYCHLEMDLCQIKDPQQQRIVLEAVQRSIQEAKPLVIPAAGAEPTDVAGAALANQCSYPLFFEPLKAANQVAMVLQMIGAENLSPHDFRSVMGLLDKIGESAETYLTHRRAAVLDDDRKSLARLLKYTEGVHDTLDPEKVIYKVANLGRDAIACDRVVIWIDPKVKRGLRAVSGVDKPDRRAVLMQSIEKLSKHCLHEKKPIVASRKQLVEMPEEEELTTLLKDYFNISKLDQIFLQPIQREEKFLGVLIAEGFDEQTTLNLAGMMAAVSNHAALALTNALEMASVPMVRPLARLKKVKDDPKKKRKWLTIAAVILLGLVILLLLPWMVKIECACALSPRQIRLVQSPIDSLEIIKIVKPNGYVNKDELIAQLDDMELRTQLENLKQELEKEEINTRQAPNPVDRDISKLQINILKKRIELFNEQIEKCQIRAPINGTILTAQLERKERQVPKIGETICEIADLSQWQLQLDVPQEEISWVQRGLADGGEEQVRFFLMAYPKYKLKTVLADAGLISQMPIIKEDGNVYEVRIDLAPEQLEEIAQGLRDGMIGRAKIATVSRPLGYVLLRKVIRFFRVTFF